MIARSLAFLLLVLLPASALAQSGPRSGAGPCRQGALALIAMLDDKDDTSADYRHAYDGLTRSCGPVAKSGAIPPPAAGRAACRDLALAVLDVIEGGRINTPVFMRARDLFAQTCAPR